MTRCKKSRYRTELDAKIALALMPDNEKRREIRTYECPACKRWHLTSEEKRT